jgi:hypothetical protein
MRHEYPAFKVRPALCRHPRRCKIRRAFAKIKSLTSHQSKENSFLCGFAGNIVFLYDTGACQPKGFAPATAEAKGFFLNRAFLFGGRKF